MEERKKIKEEKKYFTKESFTLKASSFRDVSHKTIKKISRKIVRDHSGRRPIQYWENIGPSVCLILVIGSLKFSHVTNTNLHMFFRKSIGFLFRPVYGQPR